MVTSQSTERIHSSKDVAFAIKADLWGSATFILCTYTPIAKGPSTVMHKTQEGKKKIKHTKKPANIIYFFNWKTYMT